MHTQSNGSSPGIVANPRDLIGPNDQWYLDAVVVTTNVGPCTWKEFHPNTLILAA
jgi:hypothetical protein